MKFICYIDESGQARWRLVARNGRTIASGEGYNRRTTMLKTLDKINPNIPQIPIQSDPGQIARFIKEKIKFKNW